MITLENVEAQTLYYKTIDLAKKSLPAFRDFYPDMRLVVVDNSGGDDCTMFLREWVGRDKNAMLLETPRNLGHGKGMDFGIKRSKSKYVFLFESDVIMHHGRIIEKMIENMTEQAYGIGELFYGTARRPYSQIGKVGEPENFPGRKMKYIWTYACLLSVKQYKKFPAFNNDRGSNASPIGDTFSAIRNSGRADDLLISFDTKPYVEHLEHGTVRLHGIPRT